VGADTASYAPRFGAKRAAKVHDVGRPRGALAGATVDGAIAQAVQSGGRTRS